MTNVVLLRVRRLAVALLALVCVSPASVRLGALPSVPEMLGLVPEPAPSAAAVALTEPFAVAPAVVDVGQVGSVAVAPQAPARPPAQPARGRGAAGQGVARGAALPLLPPDQTPRGRYHRVEPGDTAASIATAYGLSSKWPVYDANPVIVDPAQPPVGAWLYIPHPSMSPQARPRPGQPGYTGQPSGTVVVDNIWLQLAACESSGNWGIDTGNGYYGGLQFTLSSWRAVGGAGYPHQAHPMEQIARADYLQRIQGWQAWPMCAGKLGLISKEEAEAIVRRARAKQAREAGTEGDKRPAATEGAGG
jgi:hypothetical protein